MDVTTMLNDVKDHLEHGAELAASHIPQLVAVAAQVEADPLVQAAIGLVVPDTTRSMLVTLLKSVEADVAQVESAARASAGTAPPVPEQQVDPAPAG